MSTHHPAIRVRNLGKKYTLGGQQEKYLTLRDAIVNSVKAPFKRFHHAPPSEEFWALKDVSFDVQQGEVVGIIGRNGAGKSTLLKILSRITTPTEGTVELHGRVGSLLEVGTGFHPEMTGRENIFLNGSILGMKKTDIEQKFDEIVKFAEIEKFLDTPVKRYSSGMYVRLAFAVAAHLEPEILVVDEVLAVGDAAFQKKCLGKMGEVAKEGRTVLFVSHNMKAVMQLCNRAILLDNGHLLNQGDTNLIINQYTENCLLNNKRFIPDYYYPSNSSKLAFINRIAILNKNGIISQYYNILDPITVLIEYTINHDFEHLLLHCEVWTADGTPIFLTTDADWYNFTTKNMSDIFPKKKGHYLVTFSIPAPLLGDMVYRLEIYLTTGPTRIDTQKEVFFEVKDEDSFFTFVRKSARGGLCVPIKWMIKKEDRH